MKRFIQNKNFVYSILILMMLNAVSVQVWGQNTNVSKERLYTHLNKDVYIPGEIAWFNIYAYDLYTSMPFYGTNRVAYIDLVDLSGKKVLENRVVMAQQATQGGSFFIPGNLSSGEYWLLTYTNPSTSFEVNKRLLKIVNPMEPGFRTALAAAKPQVIIQPEGGNLVLGKANRVAYYTQGLHIEQFPFTVFVQTKSGDEVYEYHSTIDGAGLMDFTPRSGQEYTAYVRFKDGSLLDIEWPNAVSNLPGLKVDAGNSANSYRVFTYWDGRLTGDVRLVIQQFGKTISNQPLNLDGSTDLREIEVQSTIQGGLWFEIHQNGKKVASRFVLRGAPNALNTAITFPVSNQFNARSEGQIKLHTSSIGGPANLSVSVYKKPEIATEGLQNSFLVDRLLAANGVAFDGGVMAEKLRLSDGKPWEVNHPYLIAQRPENAITIQSVSNGVDAYQTIQFSITNKQNRPIQNEYFFLAIPGKNERLYLSKTNEKGEAIFHVDPIFGKHNVVLSSYSGLSFDAKTSHPQLEDYGFVKQAKGNTHEVLPYAGIPENLENWISDYNIGVQTENAYFRKERANFDSTAMKYRSPFYGEADRIYRLDDYTRFVLMEEVLKEYIPEVMVLRRNNNYQFRVHNKRTNLYFDQNPLVLLDGVPILDFSQIINYDPKKVKEIAIITSNFYYGPLSFPGVVSFKTYQGDLKDFQLTSESIMVEFDGYQVKRDFFIPNYASQTTATDGATASTRLSDRIPDFRNVLYWNDQLQVNGKDDVVISVMTSSMNGTYIVEVEGLDAQGRPIKGRSELIIR